MVPLIYFLLDPIEQRDRMNIFFYFGKKWSSQKTKFSNPPPLRTVFSHGCALFCHGEIQILNFPNDVGIFGVKATIRSFSMNHSITWLFTETIQHLECIEYMHFDLKRLKPLESKNRFLLRR